MQSVVRAQCWWWVQRLDAHLCMYVTDGDGARESKKKQEQLMHCECDAEKHTHTPTQCQHLGITVKAIYISIHIKVRQCCHGSTTNLITCPRVQTQ